MYASEEESPWTRVAEITTWVLLFILVIPGTALGYFAENSLPNSPLYPVKRGIETVVLTLVSLDAPAKSMYQVSLAQTRLAETKQLLVTTHTLTPQDMQQFDATIAQLNAAKVSLSTVQDPVQHAQIAANLQNTVVQYQQQLTQMQQQLNATGQQNTTSNSSTPTQSDTSTTQTQNPTPTPADTSASDNNSTQNTTASQPDFSNFTTQDKTTLEEKIQETTRALEQFQTDFHQNNPSPQDMRNQDSNSSRQDHQGGN